MRRALLIAAAFTACLLGSLDVEHGDLRFGAGGWTIRHWSLSPEVKPACAVGIVPSGGFPCNAAAPGAGSYTMTGPGSGVINRSGTFTDTASGSTSAIATPNDASHGGVFSPTTVALGVVPHTFTYTPLDAGTWNVSSTNNGALTNPAPISFNSPNIVPNRNTWTGGSNTGDTFGQPDPLGGSNGILVSESFNTGPQKDGSQLFGFTAGQNYTASLYLKPATGVRGMDFWIGAFDSSAAVVESIDPAACSVTSTSLWGGSVINSTTVRTANLGAGWCLAQISFNVPFTSGWIQLFLTNGGVESYTGDGSSSLLTYGPMVQ